MSATPPFVLCLTGSLAMGKSTTAKFFAEEGVPVYDSDAVVHALYEGEAVQSIERAFPGATAAGKVDREKLAAMVVGNAAALARLEAIVHPLVAAGRDEFLGRARAAQAPVVVLDVPLLFETGGEGRCDAVVVVSAPGDVQRRRAFQRSGMTEEKFSALVAKQTPDDEKRRRAHFVVDTSGSFEDARAQVRNILRQVATMRQAKK